MKRKRSSKARQDLSHLLDDINDETNQSTTTTLQAYAPSTLSSSDNSNVNPSTSNTNTSTSNTDTSTSNANTSTSNTNSSTINIDSNTTSSDIDMSNETALLKTDVGSRSLVSKVWLYAKKLDVDEKAACLLCDFTCSCHSHSTSTIRQHLIIKHNKTDLILNKSTTSSKPIISQALKKELHQLCYYAIIKDSRPFNDLNKSGITPLLKKLCPNYSPPHRNQVSRQLKVLYNYHYHLLKEELKQVYRLGVTLDFWSNHKAESFLCMTGHWFTDSIDPVSKIIDFSSFNERHTGREIAKVLREKLVALDIYDKVICITCDGAQNLILACQYLSDDIIRIWCCAHRLHLVVVNALGFWLPEKKKNDDSNNRASTTDITTSITTSVSFENDNGHEDMDVDWDYELNENTWAIKQPDFNDEINETTLTFDDDTGNEDEDNAETYSLGDEESLDETVLTGTIDDNWSINFEIDVHPTEQQKLIMNLLKKCRAIAKISKKSSIISMFIRKEQKSLKFNKSVIIDCKTRWNSTFVLTDSLLYLKHLIIKLFTEKKSLKLRSDQIQKLTSIELNSEDWDLLSSLRYVLKPFFLATTLMSGKNYPSIGLSYYAIQKIKNFCINDDDSTDQIKKLKKLLIDKLNKYFYHDHEQLQYLQIRNQPVVLFMIDSI